MVYWKLITISCLWATVAGHVIIGGSMRDLPEPRATVKVQDTDLNRDQYHLSLTTQADFELQLKWLNWALCTSAIPNASFTPMNSLVPNNTVFLVYYPTFKFLDDSPVTCQSKTPTRMGTIPTGEQTIFAPLSHYTLFDFADDWKNGTCGITFENETSQYRLDTAAYYDDVLLNDTLREDLYFKIDGASYSPVYLYDKSFYNLTACEDDRTYEENDRLQNLTGDPCDVEPFEKIGGLDAGPLLGWYGIDTHTWANGESHTFEFGSRSECLTGKYILTAKDPFIEDDKCGLFGRGVFCPLKWLKWFFDLFT